MKLLLRCDQNMQAQHFANVLRAGGIPCEVRNAALSGAVGEIPWLECAPQIWIERDDDEPRAQQLLRELKQATAGPPWRCANCGEMLEPQFAACWSCGAQRYA